MNSNEAVLVTPVAAEADARAEHRSLPRGLVDIAKAAVAYMVTYEAPLALVLPQRAASIRDV